MSLQEVTSLREKMRYKGIELQKFVKEQQAAVRAEREAERAMRQRELELHLQIEQTKREVAQNRQQDGSAIAPVKSPLPKLPKFDEGKDDMDAFLECFERFAQCQDWLEKGWAVSVSSLLTGKGLQVYAMLPAAEANEYSKLKAALLRCYDLNKEGYNRRKFRELKPDGGETASQFVSTLQNYFAHWVEMAKVKETYQGLKDMMLREQFLNVCHE